MLSRRTLLASTAATLAAGPAVVGLAQTLTPIRYGCTPLVNNVPL
jgi:hypothetical protein